MSHRSAAPNSHDEDDDETIGSRKGIDGGEGGSAMLKNGSCDGHSANDEKSGGAPANGSEVAGVEAVDVMADSDFESEASSFETEEFEDEDGS
ncbi:expressed unknown protein [Seminavis robusta]|uniref:Uncharacterized protein n=1 Tax=Seminavis robusta TaxID=568900 RepID=A0A9N8EG05_9STRA|nr:expressed unknown protein [Seminavis robusta]|eukprot:Sro880_g215140.1 n/a (93) ;mRNA; f:38670-38948